MPSNQWGVYYITGAAGSGQVGNPSLQIPPQSPSGSVTNESATWNYANDLTSTEEYLTHILEVDSAQQGSPSSNVAITLAGVDPKQIAQNNWYSGNPETSSTG